MTITAKQIQALATDFEAAWKAEKAVFDSDYSDEEGKAADARTDVFAEKILALSGPDISIKRLKARVYLWAEAVLLPEWFANDGGYTTTDRALASLFLDLGADYRSAPRPRGRIERDRRSTDRLISTLAIALSVAWLPSPV